MDENGDLKEPTYDLLDVSLKGVMNTTTLAIYYFRQQPEGGSVVINGSVMGIQRCRAADYGKLPPGRERQPWYNYNGILGDRTR